MIEQLLQDLIERLDNRYFGKYRGYVHDVSDPESRGRIRAIVPRLLGEATPTGWAMPSAPYAGPDQGLFTVPDIGTGVWMEFEEGDLSKPIWSGLWWGAPADADVGTPDSTARERVPPAKQVPPSTDPSWTAPSRTPETPQHEYPRETAVPKVRILKSATGHHIVLDDRPDHERIEIHDSKGNRLILSREGLERIMSNERTLNKGSRSTEVHGSDTSDVTGKQKEHVGGAHERTVDSDLTLVVKGNLDEQVGGTAFKRTVNGDGTTITVGGQKTETIKGGSTRTVTGAAKDTMVGGYGMTSGGNISMTSVGPVKIAAALPDLTLNAFSVDALLGNLSLNTKLGIMQLGGMSALSPLVLGDGLAIHFTLLSQIMKIVNPMTVAAYGPLLDTWAAMTPTLDLSYFGFVKRFPVG
jgi:type VI secretion system secreted protein VgrG